MAKERPVLSYQGLLGGMRQIRVMVGDKTYDFILPDNRVLQKIVYSKRFGWRQFNRLLELKKLLQPADQ